MTLHPAAIDNTVLVIEAGLPAAVPLDVGGATFHRQEHFVANKQHNGIC
jgi:hypothetical protein